MAITLHGDQIYGKIDFTGLSTEPKPTDNVKTEAKFYELDTYKTWIYNAMNINPLTGNGWWELQSGSGSSSGAGNNIAISTILNYKVNAGQATPISLDAISMSGFSKFYVVVKCDTVHSFKVQTYGNHEGQQHSKINTVIESINSTFANSEQVEVLGKDQNFLIVNKDSVEHTYDVIIYGVV